MIISARASLFSRGRSSSSHPLSKSARQLACLQTSAPFSSWLGRNPSQNQPPQYHSQKDKCLGERSAVSPPVLPRISAAAAAAAAASTRPVPLRPCRRFYSSTSQQPQQSSTFNHNNNTPTNSNTPPPLQILDSVQDALTHGRPVVALESTIIGLGLPWPHNVELARRVAGILRERGVEPATIALRNGVPHIGLTAADLEDLGNPASQGRCQKCSTRDLPLLMAMAGDDDNNNDNDKPHWGATTVASTMVLAHQAGISTFVTGGIGGVHRGGHDSMDVSADLMELGRTPTVVVSAGIKSILDISRTLQVLETQGVPTVAYQTDEFPAFFSPTSGVAAPARMETPQQIAAAYHAARALNLPHGMLVAVPNQDPAGEAVEQAIQAALQEAEELGIHGHRVTPYILQRVAELSQGDSLRSNMSLVERNAQVGADIAVAIAEQRQREKGTVSVATKRTTPETSAKRNHTTTTTTTAAMNEGPDEETHEEDLNKLASPVIVMGGIVLDTVAKPKSALLLKTSNPASSVESDGGVGRNVAEALGLLGSKPTLYSAIGNDVKGQAILRRLESECQVQFSPSSTINVMEGQNTASYIAVLDHEGDLHAACADMDVLQHIAIPPTQILETAQFLILDANPPLDSLSKAAKRAHDLEVSVLLEPTSVPKAKEIGLRPDILSCLSYATPNVEELCAMTDGWNTPDEEVTLIDYDQEMLQDLCQQLLAKMNPNQAHLLVTRGKHGLFLASKTSDDIYNYQQFDVKDHVPVLNATGAGDTLTGAFVHSILEGDSMEKAIEKGMKMAAWSLSSLDRAVASELSQANS